jgi:hypothetical protein
MTAMKTAWAMLVGLALIASTQSADAACRIRGYFHMSSVGPWTFSVTTDRNGCRNRSFTAGGQMMFRNLYIEQKPQHGTLSLAQGGRYTYIPRSGFTGTDQFKLEICGEYLGRDSCVILQYDVTVQ